MKITYVKKLMISGIKTTTNNKNEMDEQSAKIAQLWDDYTTQNIHSKTFNKANNSAMYGVYSNYVSNDTDNYDVTVGVEVTKPKNAIIIENEKYLVFTKQGELPDIIFALWQEIWEYFKNDNEYERKYTIDFEKYTKEDEVEIYISVK
jgi:predicted transcriptional regulator YdeE